MAEGCLVGLYRVEGMIALEIDQISFCTFHLLVHHPDVCALDHRATDSVNPSLSFFKLCYTKL